MKRHLLHLVLASGLLLCAAASAETSFTNIDQALKVAQAKQLPVFIDFSATWCHDCHAMDAKVLNGPEWNAEQSHFLLVRSDADSVNGKAWMDKLKIPALPTYVVLNSDGSERGTLMGFIPRAKFYPALDRILSGEDALPKLKQDAAHGSVEATIKVLRAYDDHDQQKDGLTWYAKLPAATRKAVAGNAKAAVELAIVQANAESRKASFSQPRLSAAQRGRLEKECRTHALQALRGPIELDQHFQVAGTLLGCATELPKSQQRAIAAAQLPFLKALYDSKIPSAESGTLRDATYTLAYYYKTVGNTAAEKATYERAIAIGRKTLNDGHGDLDVKHDPGMADVLSEFLDRRSANDSPMKDPDPARRKAMAAEYQTLEKALVDAYPENYSYQSFYGNALLKQGKAAEALPYLQRASEGAKGTEDELGITRSLAKALIALNRRPEAEKLFNEALARAQKQFPKMTKLDMQYWKQSGTVL